MYAVIKTGGKQQKVQAGDVIEVERLVHEGETVTFQPLLVVDDDGTTHAGAGAAKAVVTATPLGEKKGDKVRIFKYRPKSGYARRQGHRQVLTMLEITDVSFDGKGTKASSKDAASQKSSETAKEPAAKRSTAKAPAAEKDAAEAPAEKAPAKKTTAKKTTAKKTTTKKTTAKKTTAKKSEE
jgi:large subunit ribosomal protein L21